MQEKTCIMSISYEERSEKFAIFEAVSRHAPPHIHRHFECLLVTAGSMELGIGQEFFHMEKGDFALIFPDLIHHYQVFDKGRRRTIFLIADPSMAGAESISVLGQCPENPVIKAENLHPDIRYAFRQLVKESGQSDINDVRHAFLELILARAMKQYHMIDRSNFGSPDLVYQTVEYMAAHYEEEISLTVAAHALGVSPYALSRVFSHTFHTNFNRYLNRLRLDEASSLLLHSDLAITDICFQCGFESQRTFNRVFREFYRMTPREYRNSRTDDEFTVLDKI